MYVSQGLQGRNPDPAAQQPVVPVMLAPAMLVPTVAWSPMPPLLVPVVVLVLPPLSVSVLVLLLSRLLLLPWSVELLFWLLRDGLPGLSGLPGLLLVLLALAPPEWNISQCRSQWYLSAWGPGRQSRNCAEQMALKTSMPIPNCFIRFYP